MKNALLVGSGAFIGAILRYGISLIPVQSISKTLLINVLGSFLLAIIVSAVEKMLLQQELFLFLGTGLCGGFTTFSTFSLESVRLIDENHWIVAILYGVASVGLSIIAIILGRMLLR